MFGPTGDGKKSQPSTSSSMEPSQPCRQFHFDEILAATDNFDESLVIGKGGFGKVYQGLIVSGPDLVVAAIKRLDSMSSQGAAEFWAEVEMLSKLRHSHLVSLFGYCSYEDEMILIYEYMPNGTLEDHLHKLGTSLSWFQRLKICLGAARGLDYLHTGTGIDLGVIHRDVKTSNILLHESWAAKISDFGLSRVGPTNQPATYVNTLVKGTFGYLDPNYFTTGKLTRKSDVYAFGVVMLEVLCRKRAVDSSLDEEQWGLVPWAQDSIKEGNLKDIIDSDIKGQISTKCLKEFVQIAERCFLNNPKKRPTMAEVVVSLDSLLTLQEKADSSLQAGSRTMFGRMINKFPFSSNGENSAHGDLKLSSKGNSDYIRNPSLKVLKFADLDKATRHFSPDLFLCTDNSGDLFLGWVDKNTFAPSIEGVGIAVAVERYTDRPYENWKSELRFLGQLSHPNIISLLGYCDDKKHNYLHVYEYIQNRNLGHYLHRDAEPLSWETRLTILIGVARGLSYMHSSLDQVRHRDVNPYNIMLDKDFNAKLWDFDLARSCPEIEETHVSTRAIGTLGYMAPEYAIRGQFSVKIDIYSFGVVLLETLTGRQVKKMKLPHRSDEDEWGSDYGISLVEWASRALADKSKLKKIIDPRLGPNYPLEGAFECATLALRCVAMDPKDRPSSEEVFLILEGITLLTNN